MAPFKILVGSYTDSIYTLAFDPSPSPTLALHAQVQVGHHPSWIEVHPSDRTLVFTGLEQHDGHIVVLKLDADGVAHKVDAATCPSGGADPCTLLVTPDELIIGNYSGGTIATLPISTTPPYTRPDGLWTLALPFESGKPGRDIARQEASHPHQTVFNPLKTSGEELLVPDLGSDTVWRLRKVDGRQWAVRGSIEAPPGSGPRHVAAYGDTLYVLLELTNELAAYKFHAGLRPMTHLSTVPTLTRSATSQMKAAEILIPKPNGTFPDAYVYVSNREDPHPEGDTIAVFALDEKGRPELVNEVRTGLRHVRGMAFGGEDDRWLVVGGAGSENGCVGGGVKVYERVDGGKGLQQVAELDRAVGCNLRVTSFLWV